MRYSGQAVGFVEQEINARTSGVIVWMPGYVGTKVRKGEVVARLDTSQLAPQLSQGQAGVQSARAGVRVAVADYHQVLAAVRQAEAELSRAEGTVGESRANLASARAERDAALSDAESARASVGEALASLASAEADLRYWTEELRRQSSLFAAGAVSKEEYDREKADADKSEATVRQTRAQARGAEAKVGTSEAMARRAAANVAASQKKLEQARADVHAHRAHVAAARAAVTSSGAKIAQSRAAVRQAEADLKGAAVQAGFAEIRSQADGVITQRSISPGTLVSPGQTLLRVAQIQPIRLQANVPASDLARIRVGGSVLVRRSDARDRGAVARVSSISPALDPVSRTGTVEVVLENRERAFLPGQFVLLEFTIGPREERTVVPAAAIQRNVAGGTSVQADATATFVWVAEPVSGTAGRYTVSRRSVQLGEAAGELVAINGGLAPGTRVVVSGAASLSEGYAVSAPSPVLSRVASSVQILVTEKGFEPPVLNLAAGGPRRVTFLRKTDATCATEVVFPMLKITRKLPLNEAVTIDLPPSASGTLNYTCGMNMLKGQVQLP